MSTVSVFVPSYNYAQFLPACVASVLSQDGVDVRVLILDDASTDDTVEVCAELVRDPRVEVVRHRSNRGHITTYNEGIEWAQGDYTVLLSADDMLTPGALRRATALLEAHPEMGFAYGPSVRFNSAKPLPAARQEVDGGRTHVWSGPRWVEFVCRSGRNFIAAPEVVVRTSLQKEVGDYHPALPRTADLEMWLRLAARSDVGWLEDSDQAFYRLHDVNMHKTRLFTAIDIYNQRYAAFDSFFDREGHRLTHADRLHGQARRAVTRSLLLAGCRALESGETTVEGTPIEELLAYAREVDDAGRLPEYRAAAWRLRAGPKLAQRLGPIAAVLSMRHGRAWWQARSISLV